MIPVQKHSATSIEAGEAIRPKAETLRERVFELLKRESLTDHEMQESLRMNPSTQRPRRIELVNLGAVQDSGEVRKTPSGRNATVWEVVMRSGPQRELF